MNEFILGAVSIIGLFALGFFMWDSIVSRIKREIHEMEMNKAVDKGGDAHDDNYFEKKAERYGRKLARKFLKKK